MFRGQNSSSYTLVLFGIVIYLSFLYTLVSNVNICSHPNNVVALILARGGSKGIQNKNLITLNGVSLLSRTVSLLQKTNLFREVWVSTDSDEIIHETLKRNAFYYKRNASLSQDNTTSIDSVKDFLQYHKRIYKLGLFQCTSVFLRASYITESFKKFQISDCVFSVSRSSKLLWSLNTSLIPLNFNPKQRPRRQELRAELAENGMFYFSTRRLLLEDTFQNNRCEVVIVKTKDSLEIDTLEDLLFARYLLQHFNFEGV